MNRSDVYKLIDGEREYQNGKPARPKSDAETSVAEWLIYMQHHMNAASEGVYFLDEQAALASVRKVAALAVACMEHNDTPAREAG